MPPLFKPVLGLPDCDEPPGSLPGWALSKILFPDAFTSDTGSHSIARLLRAMVLSVKTTPELFVTLMPK